MAVVAEMIIKAFTSNPLVGARDNVCCVKGDAIVVKAPNPQPNGAQFKLYDVNVCSLFCCSSKVQRKGLEGKRAFIQMLTSQYGTLNTLAAFQLAGIDPNANVTSADLTNIAQMLQGAVDNQDMAKQRFKAAQYYHEAQNVQPVETPEGEKLEEKDLLVVKSSRKDRYETQKFSDDKIRAGLQKTTFTKALNAADIEQIVEAVKCDIARKCTRSESGREKHVDAATIRAAVINQIAKRDLGIQPPQGYDTLPAPVKTQLETVKHFRDLDEAAYAALIRQLTEEGKRKDPDVKVSLV